jgi:2'-5' RNA ligase
MPSLPLILTLTIDETSYDLFTALRNEYFPKHCNHLEAHLTLFHRLPADLQSIDETILKFCKRPQMELEVSDIKNIGKGAAFVIKSEALQKMHKEMQAAFDKYLISKDRNKLWPHITIQNKVTAYKAKLTTEKLLPGFKPFIITATGIRSWLYKGGPWEQKGEWGFGE